MSLDKTFYNENEISSQVYTEFGEIYKLFLNSISNDYRIKQMFANDAEVAEDMLTTWLIKAISYFTDCSQDLENNCDIDKQIFTLNLTLTEKVILADLMLLVWMDWNINNITQMNLSLQDGDFNRHAEIQNLRGKVSYANEWREKVFHQISEYTHKDITIADWATGGSL